MMFKIEDFKPAIWMIVIWIVGFPILYGVVEGTTRFYDWLWTMGNACN